MRKGMVLAATSVLVAAAVLLSVGGAGADREAAGHGGALSEDGNVLVSGFECLGACDLAPMASVDERYFGPLENADASTIVDQLESDSEVLPEKALDRRGLAGGVAESSDPRVTDGKGPNR